MPKDTRIKIFEKVISFFMGAALGIGIIEIIRCCITSKTLITTQQPKGKKPHFGHHP
jgi:uncharacterized membrane protein required for colicin V production